MLFSFFLVQFWVLMGILLIFMLVFQGSSTLIFDVFSWFFEISVDDSKSWSFSILDIVFMTQITRVVFIEAKRTVLT